MAEYKQPEQNQQQLTPFHIFRQQHQRQRQQRHNPSVNRNHHADFGRRHTETLADVAQQRNRDVFGGIENKCAYRQSHHAEPLFFLFLIRHFKFSYPV
ncbi:hypothetical protein J2T37_001789 [Neisseria perflava]|nr:hypothetical protein [Neisseria perflava]